MNGDGLHLTELRRYLRRVEDRWPLDRALLGGARVADANGAGPQRERGPEYLVILVSEAFAGVPWLERVYQCASLWDSAEMGDEADVHCYTAAELERKVGRMRRVREAVEHGLDLMTEAA
ncbi:MAG TPA: hypothetical protein VGV40_06435 [Solirubrobacteraceae bacterium]|nr:hypothetical protein [Solirubrobacteraceae bacterium]